MISKLAAAAGLVFFLAGAAHAEPRELPAYTSVSEDLSDQRRAVHVRIDRRADEDDLLRIANQILAHGKRPFARTYVNFILPGMPVNQGAWASVLFAPEPKVMVHGLSRSDEELFLSEHRADARPLLGSWLTSPPAAPGRLTIYSDHGKVFAEWRLRGGQKTVDELHDTTAKAVRRFDVPGGGYYILTRSGELEIWDKTTLIATAERIRPEHLALPAMASNRHQSLPAARVAGLAPPVVTVPAKPVAQLPSSPVQPELKAAPVRSASATPALSNVPPQVAVQEAAAAKPGNQVGTPLAPAAVSAAPAVQAAAQPLLPEPIEPQTKGKQKKSAKAKPRQGKAVADAKSRDMTTGETIAAKIAGRL